MLEKPIFDLLSSFVNVKVVDHKGKKIEIPSFEEKLPYRRTGMSEILFRLYLDELEQPFTTSFPTFKWASLIEKGGHAFCIPVFREQEANFDTSPFLYLMKDLNLENHELCCLKPGGEKNL